MSDVPNFPAAAEHEVTRIPLGTQVAQGIRRDIIKGVIPSGTVLVQEQICTQYGVSRVPIRDAFQILLSEGFVEHNHRNQMVATAWQGEDVRDTMQIEALLCGMAARLATTKSSDAELKGLEKILASVDIHDDSQAVEWFAKVSWDFHHKINTLAKSPRLAAALRATSVPFVQDMRKEVPEWWLASHRQHQEILDAIMIRDVEAAERLMRDHYESASKYIDEHLQRGNMPAF